MLPIGEAYVYSPVLVSPVAAYDRANHAPPLQDSVGLTYLHLHSDTRYFLPHHSPLFFLRKPV